MSNPKRRSGRASRLRIALGAIGLLASGRFLRRANAQGLVAGRSSKARARATRPQARSAAYWAARSVAWWGWWRRRRRGDRRRQQGRTSAGSQEAPNRARPPSRAKLRSRGTASKSAKGTKGAKSAKAGKQQQAAIPAQTSAPQLTGEQIVASSDAKIERIKKELNLTPEQEKHWAGFNSAMHYLGHNGADRLNLRITRAKRDPPDDIIEQMRNEAQFLNDRAVDQRNVADAAEPLFASLDDKQKGVFIQEMVNLSHERGLD